MSIKDLLDMSGDIVIITGGATHLGKAMATAYAEMNAKVYIASRRRTLCEQVAEELRLEGLNCIGMGCDVTKEVEVNKLVETIVKDNGKLDVMVCNAGASVTTSYLPEASIDEFMMTMEINLKSTYLCAQAASRYMIPRNYGKIITLGSIHGILGADKRQYGARKRSGPPYQAAKGGIINLTRGLATELGEFGITVNCISPGQIPPDTVDETVAENWRLNNPLFRSGVPEDITGAALLLGSRAGNWITGHNLVVDGGWSVW